MPRGVDTPPELREMILNLASLSPRPGLDQIAQETGVPRMTCYRIINEAFGQGTRKSTLRSAAHLTGEQLIEMIDRYENGEKMTTLIREYQISLTVFYDILRAGGVPTHQQRQVAARQQKIDDAVAMYKNHEPVHEIAAATGLSVSELYAELHNRPDVVMRSEAAKTAREGTARRQVDQDAVRKALTDLEGEAAAIDGDMARRIAKARSRNKVEHGDYVE